jgi:hypothetical protein
MRGWWGGVGEGQGVRRGLVRVRGRGWGARYKCAR